MSKEPDPQIAATLLFRAEHDQNLAHWLAILPSMSPAVLKQHLADELRLDQYVIIVNDENYYADRLYTNASIPHGVPGGIVGGIIGGIPGPPPWPSPGSYCLTTWPSQADEFLVDRVFLHRRNNPSDPCPSGDWSNHQKEILNRLYALARPVFPRAFDPRPDYPNLRGGGATIFWTSPQRTRELLIQLAADYVTECRTLFSTLGVSPSDEAGIRARIRINVYDARRIKSPPIPELGGVLHVDR